MARRRAYFGAQYRPAAPAGTCTTSPACASTVAPPDSTYNWPSITKLYSLCGCSSVHDSALSSHSWSAGSDQPPSVGGMMARHLGLPCPTRSVRGNLRGVLAASAMYIPSLQDGPLTLAEVSNVPRLIGRGLPPVASRV